MSQEKTLAELQRENAELRELLAQVLRAYAILDDAIKACPAAAEDGSRTTVEDTADVKRLLKKYSRL